MTGSSAKHREENEVEFSRIVAFSDGVFAIAITLLVLQLTVPRHASNAELWQALWEERQDVFAYAISFAVVGRFWLVHHRFFGEVVRFDSRLIALNLFYLAWIVLMPFSSEVLGDHGGTEAAVVLYAANLVGVILVGSILFSYAHRSGLTRTPPEEVRENQRRSLTIAAFFLVSIPIAFLDPTLAPYCWLALFVSGTAGRLARRRRRQG
ncbi:MAG TPA: TMEM175 family protein [Solirubrobacterales bacterium]